jgi:hypothetical protein
METIQCAQCGKKLSGRTDKRFCNDDCRNKFNRAKRQQEKIPDHPNVPDILKVIRNNYELLKKHGPASPGKTAFGSGGGIAALGVNAKFFTSISQHYGENWFCCFDYCWKESEKGYWQITHQPDQAYLPKDYTEIRED